MKPLSSAAVLGCVLALLAGPLHAQMVPIAVLDFDGIGIAETEAIALSNRLRNELFRLGRFDVVDRGMMTEILNEQDFQQSGCTSNDCLVEVGRLLGARQMIGGSVSKVGGTFTVSARLVDVETARVLAVSDFDLRGEVDDMLTYGMAQVAANLSMSIVEMDTEPLQAGGETSMGYGALESGAETEPPVDATVPSIRKHNKFKVTAGIPIFGDLGYNFAVGWRSSKNSKFGSLVVTPALVIGFLAIEKGKDYGTNIIYVLEEASTNLNVGAVGLGLHAGLGGVIASDWEYDGLNQFSRESVGFMFTLGASISVRVGRINIALLPLITVGSSMEQVVFNIEIR